MCVCGETSAYVLLSWAMFHGFMKLIMGVFRLIVGGCVCPESCPSPTIGNVWIVCIRYVCMECVLNMGVFRLVVGGCNCPQSCPSPNIGNVWNVCIPAFLFSCCQVADSRSIGNGMDVCIAAFLSLWRQVADARNLEGYGSVSTVSPSLTVVALSQALPRPWTCSLL